MASLTPPLKFPSIRTQILLSLGLLSLGIGIFALVSGLLLQQIARGRSTLKEEWREMDEALRLDRNVEVLHGIIFESCMADRSFPPETYAEALQRVKLQFAELEAYQLVQDPGETLHDEGERIAMQALSRHLVFIERQISQLRGSGPELAVAYYTQVFPAFSELESDIDHFVLSAQGEIDAALKSIREAQRNSEDVLIGGMATLLLLITLFFFAFGFYYLRPVGRIHRGVQRLATGDFSARISMSRRDELGELASAFNAMARELQEYHSRMEGELERAQRLAGIGRLAAGVAHEINNPLASIAACSEGILRRWEGRENGASGEAHEDLDYLRQIRDEVYRCKSITQRLLDFSGRRPTKLEPVDLGAVVTETLDLVQHQIADKPIRIEWTPPSKPRLFMGDALQIRQVILNLLINAIDSLGGEGVVTVRVARDRESGGVQLSVSDTGCGIEQETLGQIFEPFYTTKASGSGTGLGLSICHTIATAHGGALTAESPGPGKGSTFRLSLPAPEPASATRAKKGEVHVAG